MRAALAVRDDPGTDSRVVPRTGLGFLRWRRPSVGVGDEREPAPVALAGQWFKRSVAAAAYMALLGGQRLCPLAWCHDRPDRAADIDFAVLALIAFQPGWLGLVDLAPSLHRSPSRTSGAGARSSSTPRGADLRPRPPPHRLRPSRRAEQVDHGCVGRQ